MSDDLQTGDEDLDALVGRVDPDRWLSSRFIADAQARADVIAIYAFDYQLARAPKVASNPLLGEIRLTWWREALDEIYEGRKVRQHPTALALAEAVKRRSLPREPLEGMIDARYRELDAAPMTLAEALDWAKGTGGGAAVAAALALDAQAARAPASAGGEAWAIGRLMGTAGLQGPEAQAALADARSRARGLSVAAFPAVAHARLARERGRGRRPSDLEARLRLFLAVLTGRV
jgi:15-cis-phytoene synthase